MKVAIHKTTLHKVRKRSLAELKLLSKYMTASQMEHICKSARRMLLG